MSSLSAGLLALVIGFVGICTSLVIFRLATVISDMEELLKVGGGVCEMFPMKKNLIMSMFVLFGVDIVLLVIGSSLLYVGFA